MSQMSSSKISFLYIFVLFVVCRPGQVSGISSCVSFGSLHILHFSCWYLFLKFALMSSILVLALNIMEVSILLSLFMWGLRFPACHWVFLNRYWGFVFHSAFWFMVSWNLFIISFGVGVCVLCVFLFSMVLVVSFQLPFALLFITFVVMLLGCLSSLYSMFILFWLLSLRCAAAILLLHDYSIWWLQANYINFMSSDTHPPPHPCFAPPVLHSNTFNKKRTPFLKSF